VIRDLGWPERIAGAGGAVWFYLGKILWPLGLCFVYPDWTVPPGHPLWWLGLGAALVLTIALWRLRQRGLKPELGAWLYFGVMLLPVLGLVDVYFMRFSLVADHYVHLALVGVVAWAAARFAQFHWPAAVAWAIGLALGLLTFQQTAIYRDNFTLFRSVLARNPQSWMAHNNLGYFLELSGQLPEAEAQYRATALLKPDSAEAHYNLGSVCSKIPGRLEEAVAEYQVALRLKPDYAAAYESLGNAWLKLPGRSEDAIAQFQAALRLQPDFAQAHFDLGSAWMNLPGRMNDAIAQLQEAVRLQPDYAQAHNNLGGALMNVPGRLDEAIAQFQAALRLQRDFAEAHYNLGSAWSSEPGHLGDAIAQFEAALRLRPEVPAIHLSLAIALLNTPGRTEEAVAQLQTVLRLQPGNETARQILAQLQSAAR
jgi:tetratricopeptide (TPR) repeat protein